MVADVCQAWLGPHALELVPTLLIEQELISATFL